MVMSFFNKQYKRKKVSGVSPGAPAATVAPVAAAEADTEVLDAEEEELQDILEKDAETETEAQAYERAIIDAGQAVQDELVVNRIRQQAIAEMAGRGIVISASEQAAARKVLPKASTCHYSVGLRLRLVADGLLSMLLSRAKPATVALFVMRSRRQLNATHLIQHLGTTSTFIHAMPLGGTLITAC